MGDLKLYDVQWEREQLDFREDAMLTRLGWKHTSNTPGCYWLWQRTLDDGRVVLVDKANAISMSEYLELEPDPGEEAA